jgi:hypothetical protein
MPAHRWDRLTKAQNDPAMLIPKHLETALEWLRQVRCFGHTTDGVPHHPTKILILPLVRTFLALLPF